MKDEKKSNIIKGTGCLIWFCGIGFVLSSIGVILTLVFGGSLKEYFSNADGDDDFWWYKAQFWIVVIAFIVFLIAGGKVRRLSFPEIYKDEKENENE